MYFKEKVLLLLDENESWQPASASNVYDKENQNRNDENANIFYLDLTQNQTQHSEDTSSDLSSITSLDTTLTMTSGVLSSDSEKNIYISSAVKASFDSFEIPWGKFPKPVIDLCNSGQKLGVYLKTVIHTIVDELRTISYYIPVKVFRDVVSKLISKYPSTFILSDVEGNPITLKNSPLITSFIQRNNYLNRPTTSSTKTISNIPLKKKKISKTFEETCINWQRSNASDVTEEFNIKKWKSRLIELSLKRTWDTEEFAEISSLMSQCFFAQRQFLNNFVNTPSLKEIKSCWPFLVHKTFLFQHFSKLTEVDLQKAAEKYGLQIKTIIDYIKENKIKLFLDTYENTQQKADDYFALTLISKYFNEDIGLLFKVFPVILAFYMIHIISTFFYFKFILLCIFRLAH